MEKLKFCSDCRHNLDAKKPYARMKHFRFTDLTMQLLEKAAVKENMKMECYVCESLMQVLKPEGEKDGND